MQSVKLGVLNGIEVWGLLPNAKGSAHYSKCKTIGCDVLVKGTGKTGFCQKCSCRERGKN